MKKKLRLVTTRRRASPRPLAQKTDLLSLRIIMRCSRKHHRNEGVTWSMIRVTGVFQIQLNLLVWKSSLSKLAFFFTSGFQGLFLEYDHINSTFIFNKCCIMYLDVYFGCPKYGQIHFSTGTLAMVDLTLFHHFGQHDKRQIICFDLFIEKEMSQKVYQGYNFECCQGGSKCITK